MRVTCWTTKAINTRSEYVLIVAVAVEVMLHGRHSTFRYVYLVCFYDQQLTSHVSYEDSGS